MMKISLRAYIYSVINKHIIVVKNANVIRISSCAHFDFAVLNKHIIMS